MKWGYVRDGEDGEAVAPLEQRAVDGADVGMVQQVHVNRSV